MEIQENNNFCRVFELPETYPSDFCFGGGHPVNFQMVDWFQPIPLTDMPSWGGTLKPWEHYVPTLKDFLKGKNYIKQGKQYILITDFGEAIIF